MLRTSYKVLRCAYPLALLALPFGAVYYVLLVFFRESIEAYATMRDFTELSQWGGVEALFVLNSGALGWLSVIVAERRLGAGGPVVLLFALPCCFGAIGGGFSFASLFLGGLTDPMWEMAAFSLVSAVVISLVQTYWGNLHQAAASP